MMKNDTYYDFEHDYKLMEKYGLWCLLCIGGRGTGKTYGSLKYHYENKIKQVFVKRTADDIALLCAGNGTIGKKREGKENFVDVDFSPFKSINRDLKSNVQAFMVKKSLGGFWNCDIDNNPEGEPVGYIAALSMVSKVRGFDLSDCESIIFDEFIPQTWERISHKEGDQVLDLYRTVSRDRELKGKKPLKLICLANAADISAPVLDTLEVVDTIANMQASGKDFFISDRGILIHLLKTSDAMKAIEEKSPLYKAMGRTKWGRMAYGNEFAYNDFSNVKKTGLRGYTPICGYIYKENPAYIYRRYDKIYFTNIPSKGLRMYDLNREVEQSAFYFDILVDLKEAYTHDKIIFNNYSYLNLFKNYTKIFNIF